MSGAEGRAPTFAMFCTKERNYYLFAEVSDEIEAVRAFNDHVAFFGGPEQGGVDHSPYIHMEPMRRDWRPYCVIPNADIDPARNLFRQPAERA